MVIEKFCNTPPYSKIIHLSWNSLSLIFTDFLPNLGKLGPKNRTCLFKTEFGIYNHGQNILDKL